MQKVWDNIVGAAIVAATILIGAGAVLIGLFLVLGPLVLACIAAFTGHVRGAIVLILIQLMLWSMMD